MTTPPVSGTITTKEDVQAFADSCVLLRSQWEHFRILFEGSDLRRELLQSAAPTFFGYLNRLFIEHLVLHICRLTDDAQTMGRKNLTKLADKLNVRLCRLPSWPNCRTQWYAWARI